MVTRTGRQLDISKPLEGTTDRGPVERDAMGLIEPGRQVLKSPAHQTMDRRIGTVLDHLGEGAAMIRRQLGGLASRTTRNQTLRAACIEADDLVSNDLRGHVTDPGCLPMRRAVVDHAKRHQPSCLRRVLAGLGQTANPRGIKIIA